jgi:phosphoglycolate phosphatase
MTSLLIFDLDGTLIDSAGDLHNAVNRMLREAGRPPLPLSAVRKMIGNGTPRLVERALAVETSPPVDQARAFARFMEFYEAAATDLTTTYPGVEATLDTLAARGHVMAVCTNKPERATRAILDSLGLDGYFGHIVGGDTMDWHKPDPRMITAITTALGFAIADTIVIGDSEVDAETASAAGAHFVLMTYGYHRGPVADIPCWARLDRFGE